MGRAKINLMRHQQGGQLLEFSIMVPLFMAVIFMAWDVTSIGMDESNLLHAAREGATYASTVCTDIKADTGGKKQAAKDVLKDMMGTSMYDSLTNIDVVVTDAPQEKVTITFEKALDYSSYFSEWLYGSKYPNDKIEVRKAKLCE
jgi:Flp pilus assembly protein TadG